MKWLKTCKNVHVYRYSLAALFKNLTYVQTRMDANAALALQMIKFFIMAKGQHNCFMKLGIMHRGASFFSPTASSQEKQSWMIVVVFHD